MKIKDLLNIYVFIIVLVTFLTDIIQPVFSEFRYFKYVGFAMFFILLSRYFKLRKRPGYNNNTLGFVLLLVHSLMFFWLMPFQGILELLFIFAGICIWLFNWPVEINFKRIAYLSYFCFIFFYAAFGNFDFSLDAFFKSQTSDIEGGISYVFGFLALYFWETKNKKHFIINVILVFLTLKRVVLIALVLAVLLSILPKKISKVVQNRWVVISVNLLFIFIVQLFSYGVFDDAIVEYANTSPGEFSSGRQYLFFKLLEQSNTDVYTSFVHGLGQGSVPVILETYMGQLFLLHNDILKITIEHGYIFLVIFLYYFYGTKDNRIFRLCVFLNIIYFTDNALIYQSCFALFFGIICNYKYENLLDKATYFLSQRSSIPTKGKMENSN